MLHSDLLDSPSHVNIQEWRETERGKDGWGAISREVRIEKRYFNGDGEGWRERWGVREAVIMVEEDQEAGSAGSKQIAVGDPLKLTRQCQQIGRGRVRRRERRSPQRERLKERESAMVWRKKKKGQMKR